MRCFVLTGISRDVLEDLARRHIKTVELRSAHNIATALRVEVGDFVFLTSARIFDVDRGTFGLIAEVTGKEIYSHSLMFSTPMLIQESEMTVVRLKLEVKRLGRVLRVYNAGILDTTEAEVIELSYFDAR